MRAPKYYVYVVTGPHRRRVGLTHHPMLDLAYFAQHGYTELASLTYPLPLWLASFVHEAVAAVLRAEPDHDAPDARSGRWPARVAKHAIERQLWHLFKTARRELVQSGFPPPPRLERVRLSDGLGLSELPNPPDLPELPPESDLQALQRIWSGRILFLHELEALMRAARVEITSPLLDLVQVALLSGRGLRFPAVARDRFGVLRCQRCGGAALLHQVDCLDCGYRECPSCSECASMGEARGCQGLYALAGEADTWLQGPEERGLRDPEGFEISGCRPTSRLVLPVALTPAQVAAASQVRAFVNNANRSDALPAGANRPNTPQECLVWAVCGAGKTEIVFGAIEEALIRGGSVMFAIPRREIVRELEPRLHAAFPGVPVASFYGGMPGRPLGHRGLPGQVFQGDPEIQDHTGGSQAPIVLATTHQAIRFFRAFDLVILDEVDAFPYRGSRMLPFAMGRARKERGQVIYLTATPDPGLLQRVKHGELAAVYIPARHHGFPLPEPVFVRANSPGKMREVALELIRAMLGHVPGNPAAGDAPDGATPAQAAPACAVSAQTPSAETAPARVLVFVPTVALAVPVAAELQKGLDLPVEASHAADPRRDRKKDAFAAGDLRVLVATSIMERGITVPNLHVLVLFADHPVFDSQSLVQMAGRAGRSSAYPGGLVRFIAGRETGEIRQAIQMIRKMNELAGKAGYLRWAGGCTGDYAGEGGDVW